MFLWNSLELLQNTEYPHLPGQTPALLPDCESQVFTSEYTTKSR